MEATKLQRTESFSTIEHSINRLPDAILCHILSFIPTKHAVATSILSRRWRYLWASVPNLHFEDLLPSGDSSRSRNQRDFENCVDRVLILHRMRCIKKFSLNCEHPYDASRVNAWIRAAILRNVEELDLRLAQKLDQVKTELPMSLFTHEKLSVLKFHGQLALPVPENVWLPNLKVCHFTSVKYLTNNCIGKMLSRCSVLEELVVHTVINQRNMHELHIRSVSLKRLSIHRVPSHYSVSGCRALVIDTPNLQLLELKDYETEDFQVEEFPLLVKANIDFKPFGKSNRRTVRYYNRGKVVDNLIRRIVEVKHLCISCSTLTILHNAYDFAIFHNLTRLEIRGYEVKVWFFPEVLHYLSILEVFIIDVDKILPSHDWSRAYDARFPCSSSLKIIEFLNFTGNPTEMEVIEYILKKAACLEKMILHSNSVDASASNELVTLTEYMKMFTRCSKTCQVVFLP